MGTMVTTKPIIRVMLDLTEDGVKNILIFADSVQDREEALARLQNCLTVLELLEQRLQRPALETVVVP
jgi:hypothetical protein